jgi:hypothetical protein
MIPVLDNSDRARRVVLFFYILLGITIIERSLLFLDHSTYTSESIPIGGYQIYPYYLLDSMIQFAALAALIAVIVTFVQWFRRAYHNLDKAGYHNEYTNGWAAGFWFIPIANLFIPYQMAKEIWYKTQKEYTKDIQEHALVRIWWALFVVTFCILKVFASKKEMNFIEYPGWTIFSAIARVAAIVVTILLIKKVASFEEPFRVHVTAETVGQQMPVTEEKDIEEEFY